MNDYKVAVRVQGFVQDAKVVDTEVKFHTNLEAEDYVNKVNANSNKDRDPFYLVAEKVIN